MSINTNILNAIFPYVEEIEWLNGIDLYYSKKIRFSNYLENLAIFIIQEFDKNNEVRIKIHPNKTHIQWIECTCATYRVKNKYCKHLVAALIMLEEVLDSNCINSNVLTINKILVNKKQIITPSHSDQSPTQTLIQKQLQNIKKIFFKQKNPHIYIRIQTKQKYIEEQLSIDDSVYLIKNHRNLVMQYINKLPQIITKTPAQIGLYIYQKKEDTYVIEKILAITNHNLNHMYINIPAYTTTAYKIGKNTTKQNWLFIKIEHLKNKYLDNKFCYIPNIGYYKINKNIISNAWNNIANITALNENQYIELVKNNFEPFIKISPIWIEKNLYNLKIIEQLQLKKLKILKYEQGWFYIDPKYKILNTQTLKITIEKLLEQLKKNNTKYIKINKTWIQISELLQDLSHKKNEHNEIKLNIFDLLKISAHKDFEKFIGSTQNLKYLKEKIIFDSTQINVPNLTHTNLKLRDYQIYGLKWLWWLYINNFNGLLADEMGLGKTHQAMGFLSAVQQQLKYYKFLVICPTTVIHHWYDKINNFCPNLNPKIYHGIQRKKYVNMYNVKNQTIITSYSILIRDILLINKILWDAVILDEVQFIKNDKTKTHMSILSINTKIKIILSGMPIENNLMELKNIFDSLIPGYLGSNAYFKKHFIHPIQNGNSKSEIQLQKLINPFKLRRTKQQVLSELPDKIEDIRTCELLKEQIKLYNSIVASQVQNLLKELNKNQKIPYMHVFAIITKLKQICDHPCLIYKSNDIEKYQSGKFELMKEIIAEALDSNHKIVIYSQYVQMLRLISKYLTQEKIKHVLLTGQTKNRAELINQFQNNPNIKIFCASLLAGGIGIDLTAASVVIHYDRWWNPAKENQATDRVHRIGQNKNVIVFKLITIGTLEEKIDFIINKKKNLFEKFISKDKEIIKKLTKEDIIYLLSNN